MAPSHKQKRKALPKHACPCCSAFLSEKTIERHLGGTYLPTHIKVTCAAAAPHRSEKQPVSTSSSDLSSDSDSSCLSSVDDEVELEPDNAEIGSDPGNVDGTWAGSDAGTQAGPATGPVARLEEMVQDTWSGHCARVDDYESDTESEDFNEHANGRDSDSDERDLDSDERDSDSDVDLEFDLPEMGTRNGLEIDDLVDEDFQRLIAEFGALVLSHHLTSH